MKTLTHSAAVEALQVVRQFTRGLVHEASGKLRRFILDGRAGRDGVLPSEPELTRMMGVSRTVLREAMRHLEAQGLVTVAHGKRSRVRPADPRASIESLEAYFVRMPDAMRHVLEARLPLEAEVAVLAARRRTPETIGALEKAVADQRRARSLEARVEADLRFHRILAESTGNPVFILWLETMGALLKESRYRTIGRHGVKGAVESHQAILAAVKRGNARAARSAMVRHFKVTRRELK
jgi:DNA-binding FadR family transcriptional regulator